MIFSISILSTSVFAQNTPTVEIIISSETYNFGDKLEYQITVSNVTGDNAIIFITDESGEKSQLLTAPIGIENTIITAPFAFDNVIWKEGLYILEVTYSEAKSTTMFYLVNDGTISLPFWIKDVTMMWITDDATDKDYVRTVIGQLIEQDLITNTYDSQLNTDVILIPTWHKIVAEWWTLEYMSDTEFVNNIQFLLEKNIIVIPESDLTINSLI
jgi:hypothetical protein